MMTETTTAFFVGTLVGVVFLRNLHSTVEQLNDSPNPVVLYGVSLMFRMLLVLLAGYWALKTGIGLLLVGLAGFMVARLILVTYSVFKNVESAQPKGGR